MKSSPLAMKSSSNRVLRPSLTKQGASVTDAFVSESYAPLSPSKRTVSLMPSSRSPTQQAQHDRRWGYDWPTQPLACCLPCCGWRGFILVLGTALDGSDSRPVAPALSSWLFPLLTSALQHWWCRLGCCYICICIPTSRRWAQL
jgi:hypothetical protein